jgi:hypothetical protein
MGRPNEGPFLSRFHFPADLHDGRLDPDPSVGFLLSLKKKFPAEPATLMGKGAELRETPEELHRTD